MNQHHIILFVVLPMLAGIVTILLHKSKPAQRIVGVVVLIAEVAFAIWTLLHVYHGPDVSPNVLVSQMGNWPAPFGITIAVDSLSALMLTMSSSVCLAVFIYCVFQLDDRIAGGYFHPLFHLLMMGVNWSFVTGDLFNLFVAFEIMLMASYAMFCVGTTKAQMKQAYKYILLNLLGSTMFVTCAGLLYGQLGTLNMADLTSMSMAGVIDQKPTVIPVIVMLLLVFGMKSAIFPLWYWLPDTYKTLPAAVAGLFAALLTKVGAYVMIRVFVMMFGSSAMVSGILVPLILFSAAVTMFVGVLGAVSMHTVRAILSIHIISQIGYMVMGIGLGMGAITSQIDPSALNFKTLAVAGAIFFIIHNMVVKCCLFLCGGLIQAHAGSDDLDKIGGLVRKAPWLATLFIIAALSLAGLPPLSGFFGKFALIKGGFGSGHYVVAGFAIATSLFTLLSMLKIWSYGFWSPAKGRHTQPDAPRPHTAGGMFAVTMLVVIALSMGLGAQGYFNIAQNAAANVVNPTAYVTKVLGDRHLQRLKDMDRQATVRAAEPTVQPDIQRQPLAKVTP